MPAVPGVVGEKAPGVLVVLVLHEDPYTPRLSRLVLHVFLPDDRQEQWAGRVHDRDIGEQPAAVVLLQQLDHTEEEGMLGHRAHGVVGDTGGNGAAHPRRVSEQGVQPTVAALIAVRIFNAHQRLMANVRRLDRYRFPHSVPERSTESNLRAGWGVCSHRMSRGTKGIQRR